MSSSNSLGPRTVNVPTGGTKKKSYKRKAATLPAIVANPALLRTISTAQRRLHPNQPQFTKLYVIQTVYQLHDRVPTGYTRNTVATWTVQP